MENYKKTFTKIFAGQTISLLTSAIVQYAIIWYLTFKTGSAMVLAFATIAGILPQILLGPFAGVLVDRLDRKKVMMASDSLVAFSTFILVIIFMIREPSIWEMCFILAIRSIGTTFHTPSFQASIPLLAPEDKIVKIAGVNQTINSISLIVAPIVAGILYGVIQTEYIIMIDIIGALCGVGSLLLVKVPSPKKSLENVHVFREMKEGALELKNSKFLLYMTIFVVMISILFMPIGSMFPLITSTYFKLEAIHASLVEAVFSVGMLIGGVLIATWGGFPKKQYTLIISMLIFGVVLTIMGVVPVNLFWIFVILAGIAGVTSPFFQGIYIAILQLEIAPEKLGRVFSMVMSLMLIATPIGLLATAPIAEKIGVEKMFVISGILIILTCIISLCSKTIRKEEIKVSDKIETIGEQKNEV